MTVAPDDTNVEADGGVILLNVLIIVALASAVVMLMISSQDSALARTQRFREAAQATAYARAGELSARTALRRDGLEAPATDHLREAWASVSNDNVRIAGGRFSLAVADAQARFNVNSLVLGGLAAEGTLARIAERMKLPADVAPRIAALVRATGPVSDLGALGYAGLSPDTLVKLSAEVTALPGRTDINVNTASEELLGAVFGNPVAARILAARRARLGYLTTDDLKAARVVMPAGAGFTSDHFLVQTDVTVGDTAQHLTSLLERRRDDAGVTVVAIARKRNVAELRGAPPHR